jgi:GNAT superfamily N-acetyltransferase
MTELANIRIELLAAAQHQVAHFSGGQDSLARYLKSAAEDNARRGLGRTFVAGAPGETAIKGYYTLTAAASAKERRPKKPTRGLPGYPIPAILLASLAIAQTAQGQGLGEVLLGAAFRRIVRGSYEFGIRLVLVDAIDEKAQRFYLKYGFIPFDDNPFKLFLPIKTIAPLVTP